MIPKNILPPPVITLTVLDEIKDSLRVFRNSGFMKPENDSQKIMALGELQKIRNKSLDCEHKSKQLVYLVNSAGKKMYSLQCVRCGHRGNWVKQYDGIEKDAVPEIEFDYREVAQEISDILDEIQAFSSTKKHDDYNIYLRSPQWQQRRALVFERDKHQCQARLKGCQGRASDVHHIDYTYLGNEPLFTLVSVCRYCHEKMTEMEGRGGHA